jgi:peptide/nickel transport system permease protein
MSATPENTPVSGAPQGHRARWSLMRELWRDYRTSKVALLGAALLLVLLLLALFAGLFAPQNPYDLASLDILDARLPPGAKSQSGMTYLLGTDGQGRDMLSAMLYGLRISVGVGLVSTLVALAIGTTLGLIAGYRGGVIDSIIMRAADMQLSFPSILLALILLAFLRPGVVSIVIALIAVQWASYARTARSAALVEGAKEYVEAARGLGLSTTRILMRHLLPNCAPPLIVVAALQVASAIMLEATLSFLGLGVPVTEPSLGLLIANGFQYLLSGTYWISLFPGIVLFLTIMSINLVADQLRDVLNPRLER